jgi:hypothetical protein
MLAFLHTARIHVENFERLAREIDPAVPVRHEVREGLLAEALAEGRVTDAVRTAIAGAVRGLALEGARVVVCTCSTIGGAAEQVEVPAHVRVMRIDRPMAEQAVSSGRRILVVAALRSTFPPTTALLRQVASTRPRSAELVEVFCERAWEHFELGNHPAYLAAIAATIESTARPTDIILLAQASMAPAAELVRHLGIPVVSSPKVGVEAAVAMYRVLAR